MGDNSKDEFQGNNHYGINTSATVETLTADFECYSIQECDSRTGGYMREIAKIKCLSCGEDNLDPKYKYCSMCGRLFNK